MNWRIRVFVFLCHEQVTGVSKLSDSKNTSNTTVSFKIQKKQQSNILSHHVHFFIIGHLKSITTTHVTSVARNSRGLNTWHGTKCYTPERGHLNAPNVRVNSRERINSDTSEFLLLFTSSIYTFTYTQYLVFFLGSCPWKNRATWSFFMGNSSN